MKMLKTNITIKYNGKNITKDITPYILSFSYKDNISKQADDITLELRDNKQLWINGWFPTKGDKLDIKIETIEGEKDIGEFEIDDLEYSGPPSICNISAVSVKDGVLRGISKTKSWEKARIKTIINDIATEDKLEVFYDADDIVLNRVEQTEESDLSFLGNLCLRNGLSIKVTNKKIIVFDESKYEAQKPTFVFKPGDKKLITYSFKSGLKNYYKACHVKYRNADNKGLIEATYTLKGVENGKTLEVNEEVSDTVEAERLAKAKLRENNKGEITGTITTIGNPFIYAGAVIEIKGLGKFNGNYIISNIIHSIGSGYTVSINIRRCLDGY